MILHVRDETVDKAARELAELKGISITEAIREALTLARSMEENKATLWQRTEAFRRNISSYPRTGFDADKAFFDSLSGEDD